MMLVRWTYEVASVSAGMILRSVSTAVGTDDKVTVDNFADGPVHACAGPDKLAAADIIVEKRSPWAILTVKTRKDQS